MIHAVSKIEISSSQYFATLLSSPIYAGRLTKKFLLTSPAGNYLVSNCYTSTATSRAPIFAEVVADSVGERIQQWGRIKAVEAEGRLCYLHKSRAAFEVASWWRFSKLVPA
jgi:hypothetical protein